MDIDSTCRELASRISTSRLKIVAELLISSGSSCVADKLLKKMKFSLSALKGKGLANKLQE